jgi:hypothetical protein
MNRDNFAKIALKLREELGNNFLAKLATKEVLGCNHKYVIDGIRDPSEIKYLRENLPIKFI